jgi:acetylornithine deacetylase
MPDPLGPRDLLEKLVSFPTVSRETNLPLVDWVEEYLGSHGITCHRDYDDTGRKASLYAHVGPEVEGAVILSGHTDVVPVDGQDWSSDPFTLTERDGKLHGRGACDMKGFDALAIWAAVEAQRRGVVRPLQLCLSRDEEIGCVGAPPMIERMATHLPKAALAIIGEPTQWGIVNGHKGGVGFDLHFHGYEVHSSIPHKGVSAIMEAAKLIDWANRTNDENAASADRGGDYDPPYTTLHVGMIQGGTAHNITAKDCTFVLSARCIPEESNADWAARIRAEIDRIEEGMKAVRPEAWIEASPKWDVPGLAAEADGEAEALVRRLTGENGSKVVSYGTEAGQFQAAGISAVVCGPGNIAQAHQPDEWLAVEELRRGERFMADLVDHLAG